MKLIISLILGGIAIALWWGLRKSTRWPTEQHPSYFRQ